MRAWLPALLLLTFSLRAAASHSFHLTVDLQLPPVLEPMPHLEAPCFACDLSATLLALHHEQHAAGGSASPSPAPAKPTVALKPQRSSPAGYIGETWRLRGGRELSLHLTPNEAHCAPLMQLTF